VPSIKNYQFGFLGLIPPVFHKLLAFIGSNVGISSGVKYNKSNRTMGQNLEQQPVFACFMSEKSLVAFSQYQTNLFSSPFCKHALAFF
jgi:hypothetical protein